MSLREFTQKIQSAFEGQRATLAKVRNLSRTSRSKQHSLYSCQVQKSDDSSDGRASCDVLWRIPAMMTFDAIEGTGIKPDCWMVT